MPNTNDLYRRGLSPDNETERNNAILKALLYTRVLVPVEPDYEAMVRWMFLQEQGIDPTMAYNNGLPYGDAEWAIDRELAWKYHGDDARKVLDTALGIGETP